MKRLKEHAPALVLIAPSAILVGIFVYGMIGQTLGKSLERVSQAGRIGGERVVNPGGVANYSQLLTSPDYKQALFNLLVLTVVFVGGTMFFGILWAVLLEKGVSAEGVFRSIYLLPMAISFVAAGVVWRWLLAPVNAADPTQDTGLNKLFENLHLGFLKNDWWQSSSPLHMAAMAVPAIWQLSGYVMALFLAGFRGISEDHREAARIDGASEWKIYRHVLFPQLSPIALSALIIIGHMSMKMFDLIYSIAGQAAPNADVPATLMWKQIFQQHQPTTAAVNATILLVLVALVVIPYLVYTNRTERQSR